MSFIGDHFGELVIGAMSIFAVVLFALSVQDAAYRRRMRDKQH